MRLLSGTHYIIDTICVLQQFHNTHNFLTFFFNHGLFNLELNLINFFS